MSRIQLAASGEAQEGRLQAVSALMRSPLPVRAALRACAVRHPQPDSSKP